MDQHEVCVAQELEHSHRYVELDSCSMYACINEVWSFIVISVFINNKVHSDADSEEKLLHTRMEILHPSNFKMIQFVPSQI